jgi:hypothetical protein
MLSNDFTQNVALRDLTVHVILDMELGNILGEGSLHPGLRFLRLLPRSQLWRLRVDVDYDFGSYEKFDEKTENLRRQLRTDFERIADSSIPTIYGKMRNWKCWVAAVAAVANTYPREYEGFYTCKRLYFEVTMAGYSSRVVWSDVSLIDFIDLAGTIWIVYWLFVLEELDRDGRESVQCRYVKGDKRRASHADAKIY